MKISTTYLDGVYVLEPEVFEDERGWFIETWSYEKLKENGINYCFVQDNHSFTKYKGTIRGIHFQNNPYSQTKIVRVTKGSVIDYAVDLRKGSPTYKKWYSIELSEKNKKQLVIPKGFGHAFLTLTDNVEFQYKCDNYFSSLHDRSIRYDDPNINIDWAVKNPILSEKDKKSLNLEESDCNYIFD